MQISYRFLPWIEKASVFSSIQVEWKFFEAALPLQNRIAERYNQTIVPMIRIYSHGLIFLIFSGLQTTAQSKYRHFGSVFKIKHTHNSFVERYKTRLVARGFTQKCTLDYEETFALKLQFKSLRMFLCLAAYFV